MSRAVIGLATATGLAVAGCGQAVPNPVSPGATSSASASPSRSSSASVSSDRPVAPLTGLPAGSSADAGKPAVALAVSGANPQGLAAADVVFQEIASPVRYIAVYQSDQTPAVGPIVATDPTDRSVLTVLHPLLGYNGAVAPFILTMLGKTKIVDAGYSRYASLYTSGTAGLTTTPQALSRTVKGGTAPPPIFTYRGSAAGGNALADTGVFTKTSVTVAIPGAATEVWTFRPHANRWALTSGGPAVQMANLVIQSVSYKTINVSVKRGISASSAQVLGSGKAEVFSGSVHGSSSGTGASGTWDKPHDSLLTNYFSSSGAPMAFDPGPTWVILAPPGTAVSTSGH